LTNFTTHLPQGICLGLHLAQQLSGISAILANEVDYTFNDVYYPFNDVYYTFDDVYYTVNNIRCILTKFTTHLPQGICLGLHLAQQLSGINTILANEVGYTLNDVNCTINEVYCTFNNIYYCILTNFTTHFPQGICLGLHLAQQLSGINAILAFQPRILREAGAVKMLEVLPPRVALRIVLLQGPRGGDSYV